MGGGTQTIGKAREWEPHPTYTTKMASLHRLFGANFSTDRNLNDAAENYQNIIKGGYPPPTISICNCPHGLEVTRKAKNSKGTRLALMPSCPSCGRMVPEGTDFCPFDGTNLKGTGQLGSTGGYGSTYSPMSGGMYPDSDLARITKRLERLSYFNIIIALALLAIFILSFIP